MVQAFDHRAANIVVNLENQHRPAQPVPATPEQHRDPNWLPDPQFWVSASECGWTAGVEWVLGFKEITAPTNVRTLIAALFPTIGFGNKVPILKPETTDRSEWLLAANLNATILDFRNAPEGSRSDPQSFHRRATPRRPAGSLQFRPLRPEDGRRDCARGSVGTDLHRPRHDPVRPRPWLSG